MIKTLKKSALLILCVLMIVSIFPACSGGETINIKIVDQDVETEVKSTAGKTVSEILSDAEIKLNKDDKVMPKASTAISKSSTITISRSTKVSVTADGKTTEVTLVGATVKDALSKAKVELKKNDSVNYEQSAYLKDGMKITVTRRLSVKLKTGGKTKTYLTDKKTVKDFLEEQNVKVGKKDIVTPKKSAKLKNNLLVQVKKVTEKKVTKTEIIKYTTKYVTSSSMASGTSKITTPGKNGKKKVTYLVTYIDGKKKSEKKLSEKTITAVQDKVVTQGVKKSQPATQKATSSGGKTIVSKKRFDDCDGSGHGYYEIKYSDGTVKYEEY